MASGHEIVLVNNITTGNIPVGILFDEDTGAPITDIGPTSGATGVTKAFFLSPKSKDHIFVGICEGCTVSISLQMSPDGVNWCDCILSNGSPCEIVECTQIAGDCDVRIIDVSLLQFVRLKIGGAGSSTGTCTVKLHFTLN